MLTNPQTLMTMNLYLEFLIGTLVHDESKKFNVILKKKTNFRKTTSFIPTTINDLTVVLSNNFH